jgi:hypothetical protein
MSVDKKIAHELLVIPREGIVPADVLISPSSHRGASVIGSLDIKQIMGERR